MLAAGDGLQPLLDALAADGWRIRLGSRIANIVTFPTGWSFRMSS